MPGYSIEPLKGPRDVPRLRRHLRELWDDPRMVALYSAHYDARMSLDGVAYPKGLPEDRWHRDTLDHASLWWVDGEACGLLAAAEQDLPGDAVLGVDDLLPPAPDGLVVFAQPLLGIDSDTGERHMLIDAILWGLVRIVDTRGQVIPAIGIASYRRLNFDAGLTGPELELATRTMDHDRLIAELKRERQLLPSPDGRDYMARLHGDMWTPLGRSDWIMGTRVDDARFGIHKDTLFWSAVEDRKRLAALWALIAQPNLAAVTHDHGDRAERRRDERAGFTPAGVRIITLPRPQTHDHRGRPTGRHLTVRVLVAGDTNGFYRSYWTGPGRTTRTRKHIEPYWIGPEGAPVSMPTRVRVLRRPPDPE